MEIEEVKKFVGSVLQGCICCFGDSGYNSGYGSGSGLSAGRGCRGNSSCYFGLSYGYGCGCDYNPTLV